MFTSPKQSLPVINTGSWAFRYIVVDDTKVSGYIKWSIGRWQCISISVMPGSA